MLPATEDRVSASTTDRINEEIQRRIEANIHHYARHTEGIEARLRELDREWDIERTLEVNAAAVSLTGIVLSTTNRKWLFLPALVAGFLAQHALQGWCPPVPILRRMGVRTTQEINRERYALKALRGDFGEIRTEPGADPRQKADKALEASAF